LFALISLHNSRNYQIGAASGPDDCGIEGHRNERLWDRVIHSRILDRSIWKSHRTFRTPIAALPGDRVVCSWLPSQGAMALHKEAERICRHLGNLDGLQRTLGNQANILYACSDMEEAMALHKEAERICRQLGNLDGLQHSLCNQANILYAGVDLEGAMALHKEAERICRQLGNIEGLARSLINQALVLLQMGRAREGLPLAEAANRLATKHGYAGLEGQIAPILNALRQAVQEE